MKEYRTKDVCEALHITSWTLTNWYQWERKALASGQILKRELPVPKKLADIKGSPRIWTEKQLEELKTFQKNIIRGRNGRMSEVTNMKSRRRKH